MDGSPAYVATHTTRGKKKRATRTSHTDEADALAYFVQLFNDVDAAKVTIPTNVQEEILYSSMKPIH